MKSRMPAATADACAAREITMIRMGDLRPSERKEKISEDAHKFSVTPHAARQHVLRSTTRYRRFKRCLAQQGRSVVTDGLRFCCNAVT